MYSGSPDILPHFAIIGDGTTQGQDSSTSNVGLEWNPFTLTKEALGINASRQLMENWKLQPVMSPGRLLRMRCAFQWAMGNDPLQIAVTHVDGTDGQTQTRYMFGEAANGSCVQCVREMVRLGIFPAPKPPYGMDLTFKSESDALEYAELIRHELDCRFPCGWFCTGTRSQVPRCACFVGRYGQTYTWVGPENIDALTRFTTSIMLLSSLDPLPPPPNIASIVEIERTIDPEGKETLKIRGTDASAVLAFRRPAVLAARLKELSKAEGANSPLLESLAEKLSRGTAVSALQNHS